MVTSTILVVEDNPDNLRIVSWILEDHAQAFASAESGEECLEMLSTQSYWLILMDITLPGIDGKETARRIRALEPFKTIPLIACTAHTAHKEHEEILAAGFDGIITKPIDENTLVEMLKKYLS